MIKIVIINQTFQKPQFYKRWKLLSERHADLDVTLLAPGQWDWGKGENQTFGHVDTVEGKSVDEDRFHIHLIDIEKRAHGAWTSSKMEEEIVKICPDIAYFIGEHTQTAVKQFLMIKKKYHMEKTKFMIFSMRGHAQSLKLERSKSPITQAKKIVKYFMLKNNVDCINKYCDDVFCHYPDAVSEFRREGFSGNIFMQTQVGVDPDIFYPSNESREKIRKKYNIGDSYLFGSAARFHVSKGIDVVIDALPKDGNWKYLLMGWGTDDDVARLKKKVADRGLQDKIIFTGYIDNWKDMAEHWNALDCAIHAPLTTQNWEETFSLALVQAMITGLPVIGSSSGSVPYQIGPDGIIIPEGDVKKMREQIVRLIEKPNEGCAIGKAMRERALRCFSIYQLDELFYQTIIDILNDVYDENKADMVGFWK